MNVMKTILNVLGVLLAIPVSLLLVVWLLVAPVLNSAAALVQPDTVKQIIRDIDYDAILEDAMAETPQLEELMKTEMVADLVELYMKDLFAQFEGKTAGTIFHEQAIRDTVEANMDELVPMFREVLEEEADGEFNPDNLSDADLQKLILEMLDEQLPELMKDIPTAESLGLTDPNIRTAVQLLRSYRLKMAVVLVTVVLSVLLFLFRIYRLRGFIWLSVVYFITAGLTLVMSQGMSLAVAMMPTEAAVIGEQLLAVMAGKLLIGAGIYAVVAIASVVAAVLYHNYLQKQTTPLPQWN